jgi:tRNA(Ile)-lysidine synthase
MPLPVPWIQDAPKRRRYLAGISGGADSVALLRLLHRNRFRDIVVCHLDHGLRGRASAGDARFVQKLASDLGYPFEIGKTAVKSLAAENGQSLETSAREARHAFFAICSRKYRCPRLLLAHHYDDQAETLLWNLLRGSRGLVGMKEIQTLPMGGRPMECIRPLLGRRRSELRAWLESMGLPWREDATNAEPFAVRNRLRNEAMPLLAEIARRDPADSFVRAADATEERRAIETWAVKQAGAVDPQGRLHVPKLHTLPPALQSACIYDYLRSSGVPDLSREVVVRCMGLLDPDAGPAANLPAGFVLRRRSGRLQLIAAK